MSHEAVRTSAWEAILIVKLKNRNRKRSHKRDGIRVGRIRTFPFSSDYANSFIAYDLVKTRLSESEAEAECSFRRFVIGVVLPPSGCYSDNLVFTWW